MRNDFLMPNQKEKFEQLFKAYYDSMLRYSNSIIRDEAAAEDVVQEVFIKIAGCIDQIDEIEGSHTKGFLSTITRNCSIDYMRRMNREWKQICSLDEELLANDMDLLDLICKNERDKLLHGEIRKLRAAYREILVMKYEQELSDEEISEKLNISVNNVRVRVFRARKALSKAIKPDTGKPGDDDDRYNL